jgi:hypothetical protein
MKAACIAILAGLTAAACGGKEAIPTAVDHPANPAAPSGQAAAPRTPDAAPRAAATSPDAAPSQPDAGGLAADDRAAYERARPVLEKYCAGCHTTAGKKKGKKKALRHFSMDTYPLTGHHAAEIGESVREVLGATGDKPTMPADHPGTVKGAELEAILDWAKAFDRAQETKPHEHHEGHH